MSKKLMQYFNRQPRLGVLSTSGKDGKVDCAIYGSPRMIDEKTVLVAMAKGRTFANLQDNPHVVYTIIEPGPAEPGPGIMDWKGLRVYLKMNEYATSGPHLEEYKRRMAEVVSRQAADMIYAVATFAITEVRPLVDFGQGWERSI